MFRNLWNPSSGSNESASLKLLVMLCVRSRCLAAWYLDLWCVCLARRVENYCCDTKMEFKFFILTRYKKMERQI